MPSDETEQNDGPETIVQREGGEGGDSGEGVGKIRGPQSVQSVPRLHVKNSDPGPPSLQTPLEAEVHVSVQVCALAKPTIWARKRMRASRGSKAHIALQTITCFVLQFRPTISPQSAPPLRQCHVSVGILFCSRQKKCMLTQLMWFTTVARCV